MTTTQTPPDAALVAEMATLLKTSSPHAQLLGMLVDGCSLLAQQFLASNARETEWLRTGQYERLTHQQRSDISEKLQAGAVEIAALSDFLNAVRTQAGHGTVQ